MTSSTSTTKTHSTASHKTTSMLTSTTTNVTSSHVIDDKSNLFPSFFDLPTMTPPIQTTTTTPTNVLPEVTSSPSTIYVTKPSPQVFPFSGGSDFTSSGFVYPAKSTPSLNPTSQSAPNTHPSSSSNPGSGPGSSLGTSTESSTRTDANLKSRPGSGSVANEDSAFSFGTYSGARQTANLLPVYSDNAASEIGPDQASGSKQVSSGGGFKPEIPRYSGNILPPGIEIIKLFWQNCWRCKSCRMWSIPCICSVFEIYYRKIYPISWKVH